MAYYYDIDDGNIKNTYIKISRGTFYAYVKSMTVMHGLVLSRTMREAREFIDEGALDRCMKDVMEYLGDNGYGFDYVIEAVQRNIYNDDPSHNNDPLAKLIE